MSASEKRSLRERLRPKERKPAVRWLLTALLLAAAVLGLHMLLQMIGTLDFSRGRFSSYLHVPKIYLLNLLPVALLVAFTYFATNRAWLGFLIPSVLLFVMDFVNYFKVTLRGDPFVAEDFLTIGEGAGRLARERVDSYVPFILSDYKGQQISVDIQGLPADAVCWKELKLAVALLAQ